VYSGVRSAIAAIFEAHVERVLYPSRGDEIVPKTADGYIYEVNATMAEGLSWISREPTVLLVPTTFGE
jgi:hypothetical protein